MRSSVCSNVRIPRNITGNKRLDLVASIFPLKYLYLTLTYSKGQGKRHAHFDGM